MFRVATSSGFTTLLARILVVATGLLFLTGRLLAQVPDSDGGKHKTASGVRLYDRALDKVLVLGNSITLHGPAPQIGWNGNWGMAASAPEKDFVHLLVRRIEQAAHGKPNLMVRNIADFERRLTAYDVDSGLRKELAFDADLIILAIGENVPALATDEAKADFRTALAGLLPRLVQQGRPTLLVRGCFWPDPAKDQIMRRACQEAGGTFVDISSLGKDESNMARSERHFEHAGVAAHPGDKGMQAIADALWPAILRASRGGE